MKYALIEDTKIVNIIELNRGNSDDFKNAVPIPENIFAGIGDTYRDGRFYRENSETHEEEEILPYDPIAHLATKEDFAQLTVGTDYRLLMLEFQSMA